jgi:hypothetical protein
MTIVECGDRNPPIGNRKSEIVNLRAGVAQLVEHYLAKVGVAGSNPVSRFSEVRTPNPQFVILTSQFALHLKAA